jgi:phosphoglucomutase
MIDLYVQFGCYQEHLLSITKKGMDGQQQIAAMMDRFRKQPPLTINGSPVVSLLDFEAGISKDLKTGIQTAIELPRSNVLQFLLEDGSLISARPSGTEPKIKFYFSVHAPLPTAEQYDEVSAQLTDRINGIVADLSL